MVFRGWRGAVRLGNSSHGKIYTIFLYSDAEYRDHVALNDPLKTQIQREITWFTQTQRFHNPPAFVLIRDVHEADSEGKCSFCQRQIQGLTLSKYLLSSERPQHCHLHIQTWKLLENIVYKSWPNLYASKLYAGFFEMQNISHFYISSRPFSCLIN